VPVYASGTQYAQPADLANLGLVGAALATVTTTTQNAALLAASSVADSYLQSKYDLPLKQWGQDLVRAVAIIAAYDIMTSRGYNPMAGSDTNIRQRYLDTLAWLQEVSQGKQTPAYVVDSTVATPGAGTDDSVTSASLGGLQLTTTNVRGWTDRGVTNSSQWDPWKS
jgi:phage gp36-like protein